MRVSIAAAFAVASLSLAMSAEAAPVRKGSTTTTTTTTTSYSPVTTRTSLSYNWVEGRVLLIDPDNGDDESGVRIDGSLLVQPNLFVTGGLTHIDEADQLDAGLGFRQGLNSNVDLVGIASLLYTSVDCGPCADDSDIGFALTGGVRALVAPQFELGGYVQYADTFDDGDITLIGEGLFHVTRQLSLLGALSLSDDANALNLGARFNF